MDQDLDTFETALNYFVRAGTRAKAWSALCRSAQTDLDRPAAQLLVHLAGDAAGSQLHELAVHLGVEAPSVTRTAQRLERSGLVRRSPDPQDGRASRLAITAKGRQTVERLRLAKRQRLRDLFRTWSPDDRHQLVTLLCRLAREAGGHEETSLTGKA